MFNVERILKLYNDAKSNKDYELSDALRFLLHEKDTTDGLANGNKYTYPIFESKRFRLYSLANEIKSKKVAIYPFDRDVKGFKLTWKQSYNEVILEISKIESCI